MTIQIKTTAYMPEVPEYIEINEISLGDLLTRLFSRAHFSGEVIDPGSGKLKLEGLFQISLNGTSYNSLADGLKTSLKNGDVVEIALVSIGGG